MDGEKFILWTTEESGYFKAMRGTREQYDEALKTGVLRIRDPYYDGERYDEIKFYFIAFGTIEDNYDRGL